MKCEHCGGNLSLEEARCPHCGQINKHAQQHVRDMSAFRGSYEETKKDVYSITRNYAGISVRAVIITVLLILIAVMIFVNSESYSIKRNIKASESAANYGKYSAIMNQYLEEERYLEFHAFCEAHYIDSYRSESNYASYEPVIRACMNFNYFYEWTMRCANPDENEDTARYIEHVGGYLSGIYQCMDMETFRYYPGADCEANKKHLEGIRNKAERMLITYFGLTEEEAAGLKDMSDSKRIVLLEEKIAYEEQ